jgi:hypothetical protein
VFLLRLISGETMQEITNVLAPLHYFYMHGSCHRQEASVPCLCSRLSMSCCCCTCIRGSEAVGRFSTFRLGPCSPARSQNMNTVSTTASSADAHCTNVYIHVNCALFYIHTYRQRCVAQRRGNVLRNASLGDFVVVRTCTYTNLESIAYRTPRLYGIAYCS